MSERHEHAAGGGILRPVSLAIAGVLFVYAASYVALRSTVLKRSDKRSFHEGTMHYRTWCYYKNGDNWQTVWSNHIFAPMLWVERQVFPAVVFE